jgi:hypothetical protein
MMKLLMTARPHKPATNQKIDAFQEVTSCTFRQQLQQQSQQGCRNVATVCISTSPPASQPTNAPTTATRLLGNPAGCIAREARINQNLSEHCFARESSLCTCTAKQQTGRGVTGVPASHAELHLTCTNSFENTTCTCERTCLFDLQLRAYLIIGV